MGGSSWLGTQQPLGPVVALHFTSVCLCKGRVSLSVSRRAKRPNAERAGGEGGVYREEWFLDEKRAHDHGNVFVHMWICRRREKPVCSLEVIDRKFL